MSGYVLRGAAVGAAYGAATVAIVPAFFRVVVRFALINSVELLLLFSLSMIFSALTGEAAKDEQVRASAPQAGELRVLHPKVVMDSAGYATRFLSLTFVNDSNVPVENVRFRCAWSETETNEYEDTTTREAAARSFWVLGRFEPKTSYPIRVASHQRFNRESRPQSCTVDYDGFDLAYAVKGN